MLARVAGGIGLTWVASSARRHQDGQAPSALTLQERAKVASVLARLAR